MKAQCVMCGQPISQGIVCAKCDKPRRTDSGKTPIPSASAMAPPPSGLPTPPPNVTKPQGGSKPPQSQAAPLPAHDPFPKAPILQFPIESTSLAVTSICEVLTAANVPAVLLTPDRTVRFVTEEARQLLAIAEPLTIKAIEERIGFNLPEGQGAFTISTMIGTRAVAFSLIPLSGGATGSVLVFRPQDSIDPAHSSFAAYIREAVMFPLRALREAMIAASKTRGHDALLDDGAATIDQILSSLEMAPGVEETETTPGRPISNILRQIGQRFGALASAKGIRIQVDIPTVDDTFRDFKTLEAALLILMENAIHYVPPGGQVVLGQRFLEHKGKSLLLFFVMDNGPIVPEELRHDIFSPSFVWRPMDPQRTGRSLAKVREFALAHGGQVWVESKTGRTCTFFVRVRRSS